MKNNLYTEIPANEVFNKLMDKEIIVGVEPTSYMVLDPIYEEGNIIITLAEYDELDKVNDMPKVEHYRVEISEEFKEQISAATQTVFMTLTDFESVFATVTDDNLN